IRFKYVPRTDAAEVSPSDFIAGLTLDGGTVTFQNIFFEIEAYETPARTVAAIGIRGPARVKFQSCTFVQRGVPQRKFIPQVKNLVPIACIAVDNLGGDKEERPRIILDQCYFTGGQVAVGIQGPAEVLPRDCAFKPYGALFHLRGDNQDYGVSLSLKRCTAFVINGPAFRLDDRSLCQVHIENSIFSHPDKAPAEKCDEPDLIRQTVASEPLVQFEGKCNCYHNLNALWVRGLALCTALDDFRALVREAKGPGDVDSFQPGKDTAIWASASPWKQDSLKEAFRLLPVREVRGDDGKALGFEKCVDVTTSLPPFPVKDIKSADLNFKHSDRNEKIVDPEGMENPSAGVFKTLFKALAFAKPGDVIYIKHGKNSRDIQVESTPLDRSDVDVTLKPFPGESPPVINLGKTQDSEAAFFRMYDGKLTIEQLEFVLEPDQENFKAMTVVFMGGNASCTLKNCLITMRPSDSIKHPKRVPLSVVTLADPELAMKMATGSPRPAAEIHLLDSFVRGEGDVLAVRASRPMDLEVNNTLLAMAGSLLSVQAGAKEPAPEAEARIRLNHVSAFLTEPLLAFRSGKHPKGFVPAGVDAANSLFIGLGDKPFVLIEANDFTDGSLRDYFVWKGEHNAYGTYEKMLVIRPDEGQPLFSMNNPRWWIDYTKEADSKVLALAFNISPMATRSLWSAGSDFFMPNPDLREELLPFGAVVSIELLPRSVPTGKDAPLGP
ncbi:MAG TPA: hypothetical protein VNX28_12580, partial [Gemmataceae bacterium]|nr:hypothetical protein [Gemmataceae bacterium]